MPTADPGVSCLSVPEPRRAMYVSSTLAVLGPSGRSPRGGGRCRGLMFLPGLAGPEPAPACDASAHAGSALRSRRSSSGSPPPAASLPPFPIPAASAAAALAHQVTWDPGLAFRGRRLLKRRGLRGSAAAALAGAVDARRRAFRGPVGPREGIRLAIPKPVWACRETEALHRTIQIMSLAEVSNPATVV